MVVEKKSLPDSTQRTLQKLHKRVKQLVESGQNDLALADALQAVEVARRELGEDHPTLSVARQDLARVNEQRVTATLAQLISANISQELPMLAAQASYLQSRGRYAEAVPLLTRHLQLAAHMTEGKAHPIHAKAMIDLAEALWRAGERTHAEPLLKHALDMYRQSLGNSHPHAAATAQELGRFYLESGDDIQAEPLLQEALDSLRFTVGNHSVETGTAMLDLGMVYTHRRDLAAAEPLLREAHEVYRRTGGEDELRQQIGRLSEQAGRLRYEARYSDAVFFVEQQLALTRQLMGGDEHPEVASVLNNLAVLCTHIGDLGRAEDLATQALGITERTVGDSHADYAMHLNNLGQIQRELGDYATAQQLYQQSVEVIRRAEGDDHPNVATALNNLAGLYMAMGRFAEAEPLYRRALEIRRQALDDTDPAVAELLDNQGQLFHVLGDLQAALRNAEQALVIYQGALENNHPDIAVTLGNVALIEISLGNHAAAQGLLDDAYRITRAAFGLWHPATARSLALRSMLAQARGRYLEAQRLLLKVIAIERKALPPNHPKRSEAFHNLAALRLETGHAMAAVPLLECALKMQTSSPGGHDSSRAKSLYLLSWARAAMGNTEQAKQLLREAATIDDRTIGQAFSIGSEIQRLSYAAQIWSRCSYHLPLLFELPDRREAANFGLDLILRRKALVAESVIVQRAAILGGLYPDLASRLQELDRLRTRIATLTLGRDSSRGRVGAQQLEAWVDQSEALESELARQIPEMQLQQRLRLKSHGD